ILYVRCDHLQQRIKNGVGSNSTFNARNAGRSQRRCSARAGGWNSCSDEHNDRGWSYRCRRADRRLNRKTCGYSSYRCGHANRNRKSPVSLSRQSRNSSLAGVASCTRYGAARVDENLMRVFIAVDLPNQIRKSLGDVQRELKSLTNTARWVAPETIHITLKFI